MTYSGFSKVRRKSVNPELIFAGPEVKALFYASEDKPARVSSTGGRIIRIFQDSFVCVKFSPETPKTKRGYCLLRNGVDWQVYLKQIVKCYTSNLPTPVQFDPVKRLPFDLLEKLKTHSGDSLVQVYKKLRLNGFLYPLPKLTKSTCPGELNWSELKVLFHDFKGTEWELPGL